MTDMTNDIDAMSYKMRYVNFVDAVSGGKTVPEGAKWSGKAIDPGRPPGVPVPEAPGPRTSVNPISTSDFQKASSSRIAIALVYGGFHGS